jgi:Geranylgeranyl pyrophosphate synthase
MEQNENMEQQNKETPSIRYEDSLFMVKKEVGRALLTAPVIVRGYTGHMASSMGKFIRAASLLTCAQDRNGCLHENAVKLAAAVEILHLATLVHDDVIDNAELRRGDVTLQKKFGKRTAVICGDYLFCLAMKMAGAATDKEQYLELNVPDYMSRVCLGELNQHQNNGNYNLSAHHYLKIISGKTAALFEACFFAGAILAEEEQQLVRKYTRLGRYIGMIFQLMDDCMDFEATEDIARKPVQSDYEQNVITLPLIHAFRHMTGLKDKAESTGLTRTEINDAVKRTDGLGATKLLAANYHRKARNIISEMDVADDKKNKLTTILNKAYGI